MASRDRDFLAYYERERVEDQLGYFRRVASLYRRRDDRLIILSGLLMFAAAASAAIVAAGSELVILKMTAALVPGLSAAVAATRSLYDLQRSHERYQSTFLDLEYLRAFKAPSVTLPDAQFRTALAEYVGEVEALLSRENRQWVEMMDQVQLAQAPESTPG